VLNSTKNIKDPAIRLSAKQAIEAIPAKPWQCHKSDSYGYLHTSVIKCRHITFSLSTWFMRHNMLSTSVTLTLPHHIVALRA
jgi:hypothetical protein